MRNRLLLRNIDIRYLFFLFLLSLFLIKIPSLYLFLIPQKIYSSHSFAKLILFVLPLLMFTHKYNRVMYTVKNSLVMKLIFLFIFTSAVSVFSATDIRLFWKSFHNLLVALVIFVSTYFFVKIINKKYFFKFILITGIFIITGEFLYFLFHSVVFKILNLIVQQEMLDVYRYDLARGRYSLELISEAFLPFFIFEYKVNLNKRKLYYLILIFIVFFLSIISNYRSRILIILFAGILSLIWIWNFKKLHINRILNIKPIVISFLFLIIFYISISISDSLFSFNILDRIFLRNRSQDIFSLETRYRGYSKSFTLLLQSPLLGIGSGQYSLYNPTLSQFAYYDIEEKFKLDYTDYAASAPHNYLIQVLAENGIFGFSALLILIVFFLRNDISKLKSTSNRKIIPVIIASWTIFLFLMLNPANTIFRTGWFWFFRGLIEGSSDNL
ncbi:MAG: hypothetical protein UV73_C0002G0169 [Candidatus Gottesmanbacteria bacterium GW2011_GWA2_43_14]|uniref:O-antigen ligase-related domain-containing protein n=1 Tax=Candidatus Gottesmanbacteria bacterium GW2011_GWA2_43_14 TaxID=1618443 RepID=A0A0G1DKQ8_9BACT|nr:MAG: hypothetical protein UV73_C0002G0169 [Candidatus Gottesmanbacteria bacterium GW2011_GWA2_43_14]